MTESGSKISTLPTILVVSGAWQSPAHYAPLLKCLTNLNFPTSTLQLPSAGSSTPNDITLEIDSAAVRSHLAELIDIDGRDVIALGHSYSAEPVGSAIGDFSWTARTESGGTGGVIGLVLISGFLGKDGVSHLDYTGGKHAPWVRNIKPKDEETFDDQTDAPGQLWITDPREVLYHDAPHDLGTDLIKKLLPQSAHAFETPSPPLHWSDPAYEGRRIFIIGTDDRCIPAPIYEQFVADCGVKWDLRKIKGASHSPFASRPDEVATIVAKAAMQWMSKT